ncbi:DNA-processing protein DprA [Flavihumibacter stibioxidans]|uniref:DNA protecting protein DprA n=1 Tax=Flavihumibacter stibioxidans TaxID=1834163 RepID=A0ABR7MCQ0_9BACT|nr:DNA-processing protein DprA [Flavihumibacter stibioxidans]MBC6492520.1 DNA protecting protein DprA [Flavihumibacter stibioxidans]
MSEERVYQLALTQVPHIGYVHAKILVDTFKSAEAVFRAPLRQLEALPGIGEARARSIMHFRDFAPSEKMLRQVESQGIQLVFLSDETYPLRLLRCIDPPTLMFYKGLADLNADRMIAVIGTRMHTEYARLQTEKFIRDLSDHRITIISGMAYGIDGLAHRSALKYSLPTIGVLAHGLDSIYPPEHSGLAREMIRANGGLLTEFPVGAKADRHHFPVRNRVVAGLCDAVVVMETGTRGGSMITAELADGYGTSVFALPGRVTDRQSEGCNQLLRRKKASIITCAQDFLDEMNWLPRKAGSVAPQLTLPYELNAAEAVIVHLLGTYETLPIDQLYILSGLNSGAAASAILELELKNIITTLPGKRYRLV